MSSSKLKSRPSILPTDHSVEGNIKRLLDEQANQEGSKSLIFNEGDELLADAPMIRLVNALLIDGVKQGASDIHLEPFETMVRVRYRVDGALREVQKIPKTLASGLSARLKVMANLDICEKRIPQDGAFKLKSDGVEAEFRMSSLPAQYGEKVVLRIMSNTATNNDLSKLGIPAEQLKLIRQAINRPDGLILVTGPTGSGKTTTLYAALNELNDISVSVFTAEDPIEGSLHGVTQCQVNGAVGYTFASMLRSFLRQDPDVILVGEIRDQETAEISIKAALTGHLVLSTLHTNCSVSTIQRLLNMGVAAYLITTSVNCIVAQRLVRRICSDCKENFDPPHELIEQLGNDGAALVGIKLSHGTGCKNCGNTGYRGRTPIYEVLVLSDTFRAAILQGASKDQLKLLAMREGMITLRKAGMSLVKEGVTTIEEILGVSTEDTEIKGEVSFAPIAKTQPTTSTNIQIIDQILPNVQSAITADSSIEKVQVLESITQIAKTNTTNNSGAASRWKALKQSRS